jgi:hypothetical protein
MVIHLVGPAARNVYVLRIYDETSVSFDFVKHNAFCQGGKPLKWFL